MRATNNTGAGTSILTMTRQDIRDYGTRHAYAQLMLCGAGDDYAAARCLSFNLMMSSGFPLFCQSVEKLLKDNIDTAGIRTTAASELFKDRVPSEDAEVVRRLKNAGAILLGKTNLHEFAYGGSSSVSYFGPVHNPWDLDRVPGGSSGGSAAATAAGMCFGSPGTDTGGSIRNPASYCGVVGFKPTYGRVSNRGVIPLSWTLDHVGPICRTVKMRLSC
jgi:Asp-tRNA(Asn)/Glu-tRNA(Gln) amidotransferase A subunit family amidase